MPISKLHQSLLLFSGAVGALIGACLLLIPAAFHASGDGVILGSNASLLSEIRAPGSALMACSVLIALGAFTARLTSAATLMGAVVYSAYGVGRVVSVVLDGLPAPSLLVAGAAELSLGSLCAWAVVKQLVPPRFEG